ncbi:MAG: alpha/beta hydrolase family protein [Atopobiaceae bacterium]|jgi:alpha-beta hydrolase superfamily lysophospholipase
MPASSAYTNKELVAHRDGLTIYGQLYLPGSWDGTPLPCVICAHGFGANYLHNVPYAWELAKQGYAAYCFDFCGGGYASRSDGNPINMSLTTELKDFLAVVDMICEQDFVDKNNLFCMGEGLGGLVASMAAHTLQDVVTGLILLYPAFQLHDDTRRTFPTKKNIPASYRLLGMRVSRTFGEDAWDTNPFTQMRDFAGDVLLIHGDEDATCLAEYSERAAHVFSHAHLKIIHGGRHVFRESALEKAVETVAEFVTHEVQKTQARAEERTAKTLEAARALKATQDAVLAAQRALMEQDPAWTQAPGQLSLDEKIKEAEKNRAPRTTSQTAAQAAPQAPSPSAHASEQRTRARYVMPEPEKFVRRRARHLRRDS